ncbi:MULTISPECIES: RsmG family class I SAM-dependent methyltransferase [unclassified Pseudodesulfovibrio]|uniref:16S rRNA (guanine(527)-N(7))-methyltransferase RsmG n=1 Tax=unclassified Pseudodesulfovibrio TaxID=2661612 RepID=UPI000FEB5D8A|nr:MULTISPECIES: RsmG family class I SAM-dependent methyltransferase [unclassified Pseudodesulfovibrio]MCJ2166068.1 class I SAM-dependent methyltransferase [Pseudodesulfovibrio sp. S3-i]RWU02513.1 16S rRNA (guanine(527)-N(7))-methyltransferase RsmG [Pseudodesulfovibrio sp. S3]
MANASPTNVEIFVAAKKLGRAVETDQAELLAGYLGQLVKWNRKMNLVGPSDWRTVFDTLVVDSLFLADFLAGLKLADRPLCLDFGAGAGLPGIPLRMIWQEGDYWLVELREKRAMFMKSILGRLNLSGTNVFHGRAEEVLGRLKKNGAEATADLILSRAFMPWEKLLDFIHPMLRRDPDRIGVAVILSNDPPPDTAVIPEGWELGDVASYPAAGSERYFWSLRAE